MVARRNPQISTLAAVLLLASILYLLLSSSLLRRPNAPTCKFLAETNGQWRPSARAARYPHTCSEIFKGWNCIANRKSNGPHLATWHWHSSNGCPLPPLDPLKFLNQFRHHSVGFVGDSLNRNMFASMVCMLKSVSKDVRKWRPAGADRGFTFAEFNFTVAYHRTNLMVKYVGQLVTVVVR